jgi:hypothetical protein
MRRLRLVGSERGSKLPQRGTTRAVGAASGSIPASRSDSPLLEWADQRIASMSETDARLLRMLERLK